MKDSDFGDIQPMNSGGEQNASEPPVTPSSRPETQSPQQQEPLVAEDKEELEIKAVKSTSPKQLINLFSGIVSAIPLVPVAVFGVCLTIGGAVWFAADDIEEAINYDIPLIGKSAEEKLAEQRELQQRIEAARAKAQAQEERQAANAQRTSNVSPQKDQGAQTITQAGGTQKNLGGQSSNAAPQNSFTDLNFESLNGNRPASFTPMTGEQENYYVGQIGKLSGQINALEMQNTLLQKRLDALEEASKSTSSNLLTIDNAMSMSNRRLTARMDELANKVAVTADSIKGVESLERDLNRVQSNVREADKLAIKNETNIIALQSNLNQATGSLDSQYNELFKTVASLQAKLDTRSHLEDVPRRLNYSSGTRVTTVDPLVTADQMRDYDLQKKPDVIPDYHYVSTITAGHIVESSSGATYLLNIGDPMGQYGQITDFTEGVSRNDTFITLSSGKVITSRESKK